MGAAESGNEKGNAFPKWVGAAESGNEKRKYVPEVQACIKGRERKKEMRSRSAWAQRRSGTEKGNTPSKNIYSQSKPTLEQQKQQRAIHN
jgi:hypothetical protein